ncbi:hypothetical protein BT69DRAFT_1301217 [Atractiella rhizophila]|nr:hypothetical protein BT69DRAFT_1301217 [Atractiella rhizophila]
MAPSTKQVADKFYGRKDISLHAAKVVQQLFPSNVSSSSAGSTSSNPSPAPLAEWYAYVLFRTALPNATIFHALYLLQRLSHTFVVDETVPSPPVLQYQLLYSATILATNYQMDDCYSNASWSIASRSLFSLEQTNIMQMTMFENLDFSLHIDPEEVEALELDWERERLLAKEKVKKLAFNLAWATRRPSDEKIQVKEGRSRSGLELARVPSIRGF